MSTWLKIKGGSCADLWRHLSLWAALSSPVLGMQTLAALAPLSPSPDSQIYLFNSGRPQVCLASLFLCYGLETLHELSWNNHRAHLICSLSRGPLSVLPNVRSMENRCFRFSVQFCSRFRWEGKSSSYYFILAGNWNLLFFLVMLFAVISIFVW